MRWINFLERRFGNFAIPGLMRIVVAFNALVYLLMQVRPELGETLALRPERVMTGEIWRLFTYIFIPQVSTEGMFSPLWVFFYLNMLWLFGDGIEQAWGSFPAQPLLSDRHGGHDHRRVRNRLSGRHGRFSEPVADVCLRHTVPELSHPVVLFSSRCA